MAVSHGSVVKAVFEILMPDAVVGANVYWFRVDDTVPNNPTNAQVVVAVDSYLNDCYTTLTAQVSNTYSGGVFSVERMSWDGTKWSTAENIGTGDVNWNPTSVGAPLPHGCAAVVTARTSRPQTRGRKFFPGLAENQATSSTWSGSVLTALTLFGIEYLLDTIITGSAKLVPAVVGQSGPSAGLIYDLTAGVIPYLVGYQRRRKPGVGQ